MTVRFPDTPAFTGWDAPSRIEADVFDLEVEGEIPASLNGAWYRLGPDPQYPPMLGDDIYINGDGMMSMFRFDRGAVDFKSRWVQTERFKAERKARRGLFGLYRNPYTDDPSVRGVDRGTANTTPVYHAGRLFALKEDSRPVEVDPETLATLGSWDWGGKLRSRTVTAHPKIDPLTGELYFFGYEVEGDGSSSMAFCVADAAGDLVREEWFEPPYVSMVHDFALTRDYVLFPIYPTIMDRARLERGGAHWVSDYSQDSYVGVMPRAGSVADIRWFRRPSCFAFHTINAFNIGTTVVFDHMVARENPFPFVGSLNNAPYNPEKSAPIATRWTFDLGSSGDGIHEDVLGPFIGDLPRIDDRRIGDPNYRYAYMGMADPTRPMPKAGPVGAGFNIVGRIDVENRQAATWYGDDFTSFQEPQFIPVSESFEEGWVATIADHHDTGLSELVVFDSNHIADGPLAKVKMPFRMRQAFHTTWAPAATASKPAP